jgi:hypothetical protein
MGCSTSGPAFTKRGAALTGFAVFVVFALAVGATRDEGTGLAMGVLLGLCVFSAHWFAAQRCRPTRVHRR